MRQATGRAYANLAFVKYWGKADPQLNIPLNNSISMNLSRAETITTVEFDDGLEADQIQLTDSTEPAPIEDKSAARITRHLDRLRQMAGITARARVVSRNSFPSDVGIASSASGFAALTVAASAALGLDLADKQLSALARLGSGSACRSIPGGYVEWIAGDSHETSYATQIAPPQHWDIYDIAVLVTRRGKQVPSSEGHTLALNSPFFETRLALLKDRLGRVRAAILDRDFDTFGREVELEAMSLHAIAMTSPHQLGDAWLSGIYYWTADTFEVIAATQNWRSDGLRVYFTLDAGPTVHLLCPAAEQEAIIHAVRALESSQPGRSWSILVNSPAGGASVIAVPSAQT